MADPYGWTVDIEEGPYNDTIMHDIVKGPVMFLYRGRHGWRTPEGTRGVMLAHQTYKHKVSPVAENPTYEIVVVSLETGEWQTVWAYRKKDVSFPEPGYREGHPTYDEQLGEELEPPQEDVNEEHKDAGPMDEPPAERQPASSKDPGSETADKGPYASDAFFRDDSCIVCGGEPNPSGRKCICNDTGDAAIAQQNLLTQNFRMERRIEELEQQIRAMESAERTDRQIRTGHSKGA